MGKKDSSKTRVNPLLDKVLHDRKLDVFLDMIYPGFKLAPNNQHLEIRYDCKGEKIIPPRKDHLRWLIKNGQHLTWPTTEMNEETVQKRKKILAGDRETIKEALELLSNQYPKHGNKWFCFESGTHPDIYIETDDTIFIGEAKRTEKTLTSSTDWLAKRDQLLRHGEAVIEKKKRLVLFYIIGDNDIEDARIYQDYLKHYQNKVFYQEHCPSLNEQQRIKLHKAILKEDGCPRVFYWKDFIDVFQPDYIESID